MVVPMRNRGRISGYMMWTVCDPDSHDLSIRIRQVLGLGEQVTGDSTERCEEYKKGGMGERKMT